MIDNLLGSLDYTAKLPTDIKVNTDLPKFRDLTPVNINNLLADNQKDDQLSFDDLLRRNEQKYGRTEELNKPYFINRYEYERYINSDKDNGSFFNWKPNPIFKNPLYFDNEELNAQQQSGLRQFINGTSKALPSMISSFVEGLNPIPGTKEGEFQKWIHDWSKQLEYTHPNYYSKQEKDNPFAISTILDGNFWGDKVLKNAGFTIGAIGGVLAWDAAISAATFGSGTAPVTAIAIGKGISMISKRFSTAQKLINGVKEASMVGKAIKSSNLAYEGLKNYSLGQKALTYSKLGFLNYVGSNSEASIEGYEGLESLNDELISEFIKREGRKPEAFEYANIKDIARQMANTRYSINLPLLMITNAIEFGSLFSPSKLLTTGGIGFGERLATDAAGKIFKRGFKDFTVLEKLGYGVTNPLVKNFLAESFQEGAQYSIEKATRDLGFKKFQNPNFRVGLSEYMESQALGIKKTFSETEGLESMLIGGITGAITTGFTSSWDKFISKQSEKESKILDETINEYNALTEEGILDSKYFKDYMTRVVERDQINFDGTLTHLTIEAQIQKAIEDKNVFAFKALQHDKLFNLVSLATRLDKLDAFKLKIEQLRELSTEELAQNLGIQNLDEEQTKKLSGVIDEYVDLVQNKVEQMSDIIKVVNNSLINNFDPEKDELKFHAFNDLKNTFAFQLSNISDIKGRISEEMDNLLSDKMNPLSESLINTLLGQEESEQTLIIDDFTKNFVSEKGFDLSILYNKYAKPYIEQLNALNSEISTLNLSIESAKAAKLPYEGYKSKLNQKKKQLADFVEFLSEFNNKIQTFSETLKNSQDFTEAANIDAFKDLTSHVIKYEMNKDLNNPISISKADEIVEAIADLHLLNSSLKLFINDNNKFQTPKGQSEYLDEYIKWKSFAENKVQEAVRKANFETLKRQKPESINSAKSQISSNISEIEEINAQLQILNEQLIEAEDKEPIQKQIDELKAKKEELKKQNEELEKVADALENDKDLDESEKEEEDTIKAKLSNIERRRQEELDKETPVKNENIIVNDGTDNLTFKIITFKDGSTLVRHIKTNETTADNKSKKLITYPTLEDFQNLLKYDFDENAKIIKTELVKDDYTDKQSQEIKVAKEKIINAKYDAEYVDAVKNGEITKEQAKAALNRINRLTPELEKQIDNTDNITVKKEESNNSEISTIETVIPTTGITIDIQSQNKLDAPLEQLEKQDFNGRLHFKRTTDVEKTDGTGRTERFQSLLESFITNNGVSQTQNLNSWLENNKLKFVIMRPIDEMFNNKTFREEFKDVNNELKSAVLVLVDENNKPIKIKDNKIDETGEFIVETLPTRQKKSTWSDQLQIVHDKEHKQLHDAVNKIKSSSDGAVIETKITAVADGVYRFMVTGEFGKVLKVASPLTKSTLNSANSELFINTTGENLKVGNFTLQKGRLYLKIFNEDKTLFYFPISLGAISGSKTGDNIHSVLEYVFKNHKTLKEESETKLIAIQNYLNSVLYDGVDLNLPGDVKFRVYTNLLGDKPIFEINREKDGKKYTLQYSLATPTFSKKILFDFLKGVDINSITLSKTDEFTLPKVEKDTLSIEKINYADFILEQTQPTIPYKIDLSKGFDRVKQAVYFDIQEQNELLSNAPKSTEQEQITPEQVQSDIVPVYHHTSVSPENFNFSNFQRGKQQISQFGDGLSVSTTTTPFLIKRYGNPIQGEVKNSDFVVIDTNKSEKELYEELLAKGFKFNNPATDYQSKEKANQNPAVFDLFNDFQNSNPQVKGVKVINHIIGNEKVDPFYVIYDVKSFYGSGSLSKKSNQVSLSDIEAKKADIERREELIEILKNKPWQERAETLYKEGIIDDIYNIDMGRPIIIVNIAGEKLPFYRSLSGTSGKTKDKWYPFFGFGKHSVSDTEEDWFIKGTIKDLESNFGSSAIEEYSNIINTLFDYERSLDRRSQITGNPFIDAGFKPLIGINKLIYGTEESGVVNDGGKSIEKSYDIIRRINKKYDTELAALKQKETPKAFEAQDVTVKKDEKSNWNLTVNSDGTVLNKNTNKLLDERLDKNLINKAHLKSGFLKYEKVTASNKKEYAVTEDGRVISLAKTSLGAELDVENSSIAKDALKKSTKFKVETPIVEEIKSENPKIATDNSTLVEEPTKEKKKFNKGNINIELKSAKKLPIVQSLGVTQTDIERVKGLFPHDVNIDNLFNVANSDAWATWSQSAITLFKGATRADLYHEAWHHFSQLYLTKDEKKRLYGETRDRVKELEGKSDLEVEEYIAREFAKFTETGKIEGKYPERKSIFEKIWNFLKSIFSNKTDLSLETLFNDLYKGQVNPLNYSTDNIMFGKLNSGINDNFSIIEADILNSGLDALVVQALQEFDISETQVYKLKDSNQLYEAIRNYIIDLYEQSENSIITSKLEKVLENWNDVKKAHLEYTAKKKGIKVNVEIDENNQLTFKEENEDEKKGRNSSDFSEASEKTIYDLMDTEVQSLIRNLVDKDEKGNEIIDPIFGLPRLVDFAKYVELLKDSFDDSQDFNQMVEKMNELSKKYPAIKDLVNRLFVNESPDVKLLRIKFVSSLGLVNKALVEAHITENGVIVDRDASNSKKRQVEYDVTSYFFKAPENNLISKVDGENVIASDKVSEIEKYNLLDINEQVRFLQDIGLDVSNLYKELNEKDKKQLFNPNSLIYLRDHIIKYLSTKGDIKNIVEVLQTPLVVKEGSKASKEVKVFKKLVELNQKYLAQYISGAFLNPDGKLEQSKVQWSTQDKVITKLRKAKKIQDLFSDPNFTHLKGFLDGSYLDMSSSKLLDYLFDKKTGERKLSSLTTDNYVGISSSDETKDGMKTKAMYSKDKMVSDINMFAQSNRLTTMQLSNKATHHTFQFNKPLVDSIDDFIDTMYIYLQDELNIIKSFDEGNRELTKLKKLPKSIKNAQGEYQFAIFKDIIKDQDAQSIIADFLKDGKLSNANIAKVRDAIKQFILEEKQATVEILGGFTNEIKTDVDRYRNASKELIIQDYIQNQFVFNVELSKLVYGNPYMHTDPYKRIAGASSAGRSILSDQTFLDYYNEMTTSTQRSKTLDLLQSKVGGEYKLQTRKSDKEIRYFVAKDREVQSEYFKEILKAVDAELAKNPNNLELQEKRKAIENAYKEVNGSDAMGACTIDFWRKSLLLSGRWDFHTLEPFYQKVVNWDYYNRLMKSAENPQQELEYFTEREKYNISDEEMVNVAILKYQYYGTVENESIAEKAFHKFQLMPLMPQVVEGKNWSNHLDRMIYEDVDYMMFESASKLEQDKQVDNFYAKDNKTADFTSQISNYQSGINSYNIKTGFLDNLKEQVFMENGVDDSLLFGSQVRKLLFNTDDFSDLYDEFRNTIQSLTDIEKDNLKKLSGLDDEGKVTDNQKFVKFLLDEIDKKTVNKNVREYLRLTNEGNFAHSLDTNIQRQPIESIINSVVNSRLVKQKMHGEMLVQVSNVGFESLEDGKGLKFYSLENGKVRKMQVKIPLTGKFKNLLNLVVDGQKVGTRERLNQLLKEGKIDTRSITMVGYRIPTQEHNSIEIMEVEEFLHPSLNGIVVPYEITAKAGSDFDIDKLNIFKPHIDENGYYVEKKFNTKSEAVDNYLQTKERINPLIKDIRIEKFNWQSNLVQETERVKKDIFERIQTLKNDLSFYKGQLRDNIVFNAMVYEKNQIINQMYQLFDDYRALRNKEDIGGEYEYKRGNPDYKYKDTLKFTVNEEVREYLNRTNSSFMKALFDEYTDISDETPIYDVKNEIVKEYNDRLSALLNVTIALDAEFINNKDLKNKINELNGTKGYDSTGTFTGVSGEIQNLYSQLNSVFTNSKSAKIFIKGEMPEELKQIYERVMGYQFELSEELNKLYIDKNQAFLDMVNFKNSNQNKIIEIFDKVLLDPSNYLNLITPNSTFMFDGAMDNIFEALYPNDIQTKKGKKMPKDLNLTKSLLPRSSWQTKAILDEAGQALSIAAVGNTFTQLIQKANVEFTEGYLKKYKLLFEPESISKRTLSNGLSKATAYSQLINIYVDIGNDPRAGYSNMGDRVTPIINTMINMGLAIDTILYFINQPIIRDFVEYEGMVKNSLFKGRERINVYNEFLKYIGESGDYNFGSVEELSRTTGELMKVNYSRFLKTDKKDYSDITNALLKEDVTHEFSNEEFKSSLGSTNSINEKFAKEQLLLLTQYMQLSEISSDYRELQSSMNFDTTVAKDGFDSEQREKAFEEVIKKGIFTNLDVLKTKTVIAPLNISKELKNLNESLLPLVNSSTFYSFLSNKLESNFKNSTSKVKGRFVRTFKNDLISYIFQNLVTRSGAALTRFNETFAPVLGEFKNKPNEFGLSLLKNLYKEMIVLQENKPELANQYTILNNLFIVSEKQFKNIALSYFNKDSQLQDSYIEQFKELLNHKDLEVRNFMLKFAYMSFFQSGLNKSFISSADIIPAHVFAPILDAAREQYFKEVNTPQKQVNILKDVFDKFLENNDRFRAKEDNRGKSDFNTLGVKSDKGKWYVSNIDEVLNPTLSVLDKQKVDLTNAIEFEGYYILDNKVYNNQGIEIYNPDVLQDFKMEKIKPTEEQQKVIDRVKEFIKSPNKELLSPENVLMISGAGGTGKTFSITRAARQLQKEKYVSIAFSAPTHNAKRELQKSLNDVYGKNRETAHTNASLFALDYNPITGKTTKRAINESFPPEYWNKSVIILDEYSMLGGELWKMIQERLVEKQEKGYGHTKIIFTGDYAQIPVPDSSRKEFMDGDVTNWIYHDRKDRVEGLYTNMRAKFADLANTSARIRTYIDRINNAVIYKTTQEKPEEIIKDFNNSFIKNKETSTNVKYYNANNKVQWIDSYIDAYKNLSNRNPYFGVIVNYNNSAHINNINLTKKIREELFGLKSSNRFNEGELLIIDNNTLNAGVGTLGKDMRVYVESVTKTKRKQNFSYKAKGIKGEKYFSIEFDAYQITATTDGEDVFTFYVPIINETVLDKYKNQDFDFLNIQGEKPENINQLIAIIDPNIAQVSYGYVVNSHKVQGSSYDQVWVQEDNILTAREPKEVLQLLYTAYSRPKFKTHSLNNNSNIEIKKEFEPYKKENESTVQQSEVNTVEQNVEVVSRYSNADLKANPNKIYVFGDNTQRVGTGGQAQIRNNPNAFGIATKLKPTMNADAFMTDKDLESNKQIIDSDIAKIKAQNKIVVLPKDGFGTGLAKLKEKAPQTYEYLKQRLLEEFGFNNDTGEIVKQLETKDTQITKKETKTACEGGLNI